MSTFNYRQEVEAKKSTKSNVEQVVSVPATIDRPSRVRISAGGPPHIVVWGAADHTEILYNNVI